MANNGHVKLLYNLSIPWYSFTWYTDEYKKFWT